MATLKEELDEVSMLDDRDYRYNREIYEDVKEAVLKFEKHLEFEIELLEKNKLNCSLELIRLKVYKQTFGDFKK
jgi:hypothetical protein